MRYVYKYFHKIHNFYGFKHWMTLKKESFCALSANTRICLYENVIILYTFGKHFNCGVKWNNIPLLLKAFFADYLTEQNNVNSREKLKILEL